MELAEPVTWLDVSTNTDNDGDAGGMTTPLKLSRSMETDNG